jgi:AraC-like DNA-binding protein
MKTQTSERPPIQFSCYFTHSRDGEQFVPIHTLGYILAGSSTFDDGDQPHTFHEGDVFFCRRNHLMKYEKTPPKGGEYRSITLYLREDLLREFSLEYGYTSTRHLDTPGCIPLPAGSVLAKYLYSLKDYESLLSAPNTPAARELLTVKQKEGILILLNLRPELKDVLFDFSEPGKIDLEGFMNEHYHFNVDLPRFAYLTGRSLSTFKRDFEKTFHETPSRWLLQRRLEEAHRILKDKKKTASDIYLDLGFEDLSHFSFAFKKRYGISPSMVM